MADAKINHEDANAYWEGVDASVDGMLGGFPYLSRIDLQNSKNFLARCGIGGKDKDKVERAVDCGAGIGRITEGLLLNLASTVDIVEPIFKFTADLEGKPGIGTIFNVGLESWSPSLSPELAYDLIWNQWCLGHLTDAQLIVYFQKSKEALKEGGWIVVKENMSTSEADVFDKVDSSVTRLDEKFREIFKKSGLEMKRTAMQKGMPKNLYPVRMYALQPERL